MPMAEPGAKPRRTPRSTSRCSHAGGARVPLRGLGTPDVTCPGVVTTGAADRRRVAEAFGAYVPEDRRSSTTDPGPRVRGRAAVLFADVSGFTALTVRLVA